MMGGMREMDHRYEFTQNTFASGQRQELYASYPHLQQDIFEQIALPDDLLHEYYSEVRENSQSCLGLCQYDSEGLIY